MNISQDNTLLVGKMIMLSSKAYQNLSETHFQERYFHFKNSEMKMVYKMHIRKDIAYINKDTFSELPKLLQQLVKNAIKHPRYGEILLSECEIFHKEIIILPNRIYQALTSEYVALSLYLEIFNVFVIYKKSPKAKELYMSEKTYSKIPQKLRVHIRATLPDSRKADYSHDLFCKKVSIISVQEYLKLKVKHERILRFKNPEAMIAYKESKEYGICIPTEAYHQLPESIKSRMTCIDLCKKKEKLKNQEKRGTEKTTPIYGIVEQEKYNQYYPVALMNRINRISQRILVDDLGERDLNSSLRKLPPTIQEILPYLDTWLKFKQIFVFDDSLVAELLSDPKVVDEIRSEAFEFFPFAAIYVQANLSNKSEFNFFAQFGENEVELARIVQSQVNTLYRKYRIELLKGQKIRNAISKIENQQTRDEIRGMLQLCLCLSTTRNERVSYLAIPENRTNQNNNFNSKSVKVGSFVPEIYTVTFNLGAKNSIGSNAKGNKSQNSRRSHIRKAHWHYYNVGSGDSKRLELRWVREISVNDNTAAHSVRIVLVRQNR